MPSWSAHESAPEEMVLDLDATDDPIHGQQEGRFFHGYYRHYCYLPLYIFSGEHLLCARLRCSNIDGAAGSVEELERIVGRIRQSWPEVSIIIRADSGFCREALLRWCEAHQVDYVVGLAKNDRLQQKIAARCSLPWPPPQVAPDAGGAAPLDGKMLKTFLVVSNTKPFQNLAFRQANSHPVTFAAHINSYSNR